MVWCEQYSEEAKTADTPGKLNVLDFHGLRLQVPEMARTFRRSDNETAGNEINECAPVSWTSVQVPEIARTFRCSDKRICRLIREKHALQEKA